MTIRIIPRLDIKGPNLSIFGLAPEWLIELCDQARSSHLWKKESGEWHLRRAVWMEEEEAS